MLSGGKLLAPPFYKVEKGGGRWKQYSIVYFGHCILTYCTSDWCYKHHMQAQYRTVAALVQFIYALSDIYRSRRGALIALIGSTNSPNILPTALSVCKNLKSIRVGPEYQAPFSEMSSLYWAFSRNLLINYLYL
jgi:hypothetical protein